MKRKLLALVLALGLTLSVSGLPTANAAPAQPTITELTFCESWDFEYGYYPVATPDSQSNYGSLYWAANFYDTLIQYDDGEFVPGLAESWEVSEDGKVYTFKLRGDVKFSDGSPFTSEAVKKTFEAAPVILGQYNGSYGTLTTLFEEIVCPDEHTVELHLTQPYYGTLKDLTMTVPLGIVNPAMLGEDGMPGGAFLTATHGTGPFLYEGDGDGSAYTFVRNPYYWGEAPALERFRVKVIPDNNAKLLALKSGEIDVIIGSERLSYDGYNEMKNTAGFDAVTSGVLNNTRLLAFNMKHAAFGDLAVRDALARAIDKDAICERLLSGLETKADTLFPKSYPYCDVDIDVRAFDVDAARKGLDEAGWVDADGDGIRERNGVALSGSMVYIAGNPVMEDLALVISAQAKEIGIELVPKGGDMMTYYTDIYGDFGVVLHYTYGLTFDPYSTIANMNPETSTDPVAMQAIANLPDPAGLIRTLNSTADEEVVGEIYRTILTNINDNAIFIPISEAKVPAAYNAEKVAVFGFHQLPPYLNVAAVTPK